jgi:hypothetical protein
MGSLRCTCPIFGACFAGWRGHHFRSCPKLPSRSVQVGRAATGSWHTTQQARAPPPRTPTNSVDHQKIRDQHCWIVDCPYLPDQRQLHLPTNRSQPSRCQSFNSTTQHV